MLQVRNRTSAWCAARRSPRAATWSRICVSTPVTSRFNAGSATRRFKGRSTCEGTGKVSTRRRRRLTTVLCRCPRSNRTATGARPCRRTRHLRRVTTWYPCPAVAETRSPDRRFVRERTEPLGNRTAGIIFPSPRMRYVFQSRTRRHRRELRRVLLVRSIAAVARFYT